MLQNSVITELYRQHFPFWEQLTEVQKELLCTHTSSSIYHKGENIHGASGECTGTIFVKSGQIRAYLLSEEGREITLYRLGPGDICMLSASCVLNAITFDVFVDAETESEVFILNAGAFATLTAQNVYAENFALGITAARFSEVMWAMQQILFMSFDKRLAVFLLDELSKTGGDTIRLTQEQIAKYMGSAREVVSRMLKYFSGEKIVSVSRGGVTVLDKPRLREMTL